VLPPHLQVLILRHLLQVMGTRFLCTVILMAVLDRGSAANSSSNAPNDSSVDTGPQGGWCPTRCACSLLYRVDCMNVELHNLSSSMFPINSSKIRDLWLDYANLTTLEVTVFSGMKHLRRLSLANNYLRELDGRLFSDLFGLRYLDLRNNCLVSPLHTKLFQSTRQLRSLKLDYNKLTRLETKLLTPISDNITEISLSNNPFICDCDIRGAAEWFKVRRLNSEATCAYPSAGESLKSLPLIGHCESPRPPNIDLTCKMMPLRQEDNNSSMPLIFVLAVTVCGSLALACGGLSLYFWRRDTTNESTNPNHRVNENKLYDDIGPIDSYYYETVRTQVPRYLLASSSRVPATVPQLPKTPQRVHNELRDSCESTGCDDVHNTDTDSYIEPETVASEEKDIPADAVPAPTQPTSRAQSGSRPLW
jgi:hypothetical protein